MAEENKNQNQEKNPCESLIEALKQEGVVLTTKDALEAKTSEACNTCFAWGMAAGAVIVAATGFIVKKLNEED